MKSIEVLALGIRIVGIFAVLKLLQFFSYSYAMTQRWALSNPGESVSMWLAVYGVSGLVLVAACFVLIRFPMIISNWLLPKTDKDEPVFSGGIDDLTIAAFTILGVYILSSAIPDLVHNLGMLVQMRSQGIMDLYNAGGRNEYIVKALATILQIGIGLYLCFQAKGLNALLLKFRGMNGS